MGTNTSNRPATPTVVIARILRGYGLKQGADFRVKGFYSRNERIGTFVVLYTRAANELVTQYADAIEAAAEAAGCNFHVSISYSGSGSEFADIANFGERTREVSPAAIGAGDEQCPPVIVAVDETAEVLSVATPTTRADQVVPLMVPKVVMCEVCGKSPIAYRNYLNQGFCWPCADGERLGSPAVGAAFARVSEHYHAGYPQKYVVTATVEAVDQASVDPETGEPLGAAVRISVVDGSTGRTAFHTLPLDVFRKAWM